MDGFVFRKSVTRDMPPGAVVTTKRVRSKVKMPDGTKREEITDQTVASWKDTKGKTKIAPVTTTKDGVHRIRVESKIYSARYRNEDGLVVEVSTGCRDEGAARLRLAELKRAAERVQNGVLTSAEAKVVDGLRRPIAEHFTAYLDALEAAECVLAHRQNTKAYLYRLAADCGFGCLADLSRQKLESWMVREKKAKRSARSRNTHRAAIVAFANWCCEDSVGRLLKNPVEDTPKADEEADPRRKRRSMTEDELVRLLDVARDRPLQEALTVRRGKRKGEMFAKVRPDVRARLELLGRERALVYKTLVLTGLRKNELATLTIAQLRLDGRVPTIELDAADEKNGQGNYIVLRDDLATDLREWLADKLAAVQLEATNREKAIPSSLPGHMKLFYVPTGLDKIFNRDLKAAGIAKRDDRGYQLDPHALRTTFGTLLAVGGVSLRTTQEAMRHSDPKLTANVYTDPRLLDVQGGLGSLPSLPLGDRRTPSRQRLRATGTAGPGGTRNVAPNVALDVAPVAPNVALNPDKVCQLVSLGDKSGLGKDSVIGLGSVDVNRLNSRDLALPIALAKGDSSVRPAGFEPATSSFGVRGRLVSQRPDDTPERSVSSRVASSAEPPPEDGSDDGCTKCCTEPPTETQIDLVEELFWSLDPEQRRLLRDRLNMKGVDDDEPGA